MSGITSNATPPEYERQECIRDKGSLNNEKLREKREHEFFTEMKNFVYTVLDEHMSKFTTKYEKYFDRKNQEISLLKQKMEEINDIKLNLLDLHDKDRELQTEISDYRLTVDETYSTIKDHRHLQQEMIKRVFKTDFEEQVEKIKELQEKLTELLKTSKDTIVHLSRHEKKFEGESTQNQKQFKTFQEALDYQNSINTTAFDLINEKLDSLTRTVDRRLDQIDD